nr:nicotinamide/nicotinic acid mononucleotide adenylyltransferase 3 isoform X1 [Leptinotarsa decemlineata]XP_023029132.1 nicotinamide/nicotinic acid mononucleotide adenylyltransferase 3 isoform X1 [Leptinotarsa decemlineata]
MAPSKVILLACGSFNPPTNMHLRMFEIARDHLHRMGTYVVVGGIISPVHDAYGKKELESSTHRLGMVRAALQNHDWVKLSDWESKQETWTRTKHVLQHHQNQLNAVLNQTSFTNNYNMNEADEDWIPENVKNGNNDPVKIKLLCGADLLESFAVPGLWADEDISEIVGQYGLVVITRSNTNPVEFIYNSDVLTKYMANIIIVTEWIRNEVSSTKIRTALRRSESVRYLLPGKVINYIHKFHLFGSEKTKYLLPPNNNLPLLTPSPTDITMGSPSPTNCMYICNNNLFSRREPSPDITKANLLNSLKHPGQAVKIITESSGEHKIIRDDGRDPEVGNSEDDSLKTSKSYPHFDEIDAVSNTTCNSTKTNLKECKSCDENLIKFIFTKHGIQVISDVETIV